MPERLDGADFVAAADSAVFGSSRPWAAAQYGGCGESNEHGGVNVPAALLAGSMNVSRESGECKEIGGCLSGMGSNGVTVTKFLSYS